MTVKELIKMLESADPWAQVYMPCPTGGTMECTIVEIQPWDKETGAAENVYLN